MNRIIMITTVLILAINLVIAEKKQRPIDYLFEQLSEKTEVELINHLKVASRNYQGKFDLNVLVPIQILIKRENKSIELLGEALFDKENYIEEVRIEIIRALESIHTDEVIPFIQKATLSLDKDISTAASIALSSFKMFAGDILLKELRKVIDDKEKRRDVLKQISYKSNTKMEGNIEVYNDLVDIIYDKKIDDKSRSYALIALGGVGIRGKEVMQYCKEGIPNEDLDFWVRRACISTISSLKEIEYLDLIYSTILKTNDLRILKFSLYSLMRYQLPLADEKIANFKKVVNSKTFMSKKQIAVTKFYSNSSNFKNDDGGLSSQALAESKDIIKSFKRYLKSVEWSGKRLKKYLSKEIK